jgi:hypothetical protein
MFWTFDPITRKATKLRMTNGNPCPLFSTTVFCERPHQKVEKNWSPCAVRRVIVYVLPVRQNSSLSTYGVGHLRVESYAPPQWPCSTFHGMVHTAAQEKRHIYLCRTAIHFEYNVGCSLNGPHVFVNARSIISPQAPVYYSSGECHLSHSSPALPHVVTVIAPSRVSALQVYREPYPS